jgi:hypothetical protein
MVGVEPDEAVAKGEVPLGSVTGRPLQWNRWKLLETGDESSDIDRLLRALYDRLAPVRVGLQGLPGDECEIELVVVAHYSPDEESTPGFHFDLQFVEFLAAIGAGIDIDQYVIA